MTQGVSWKETIWAANIWVYYFSVCLTTEWVKIGLGWYLLKKWLLFSHKNEEGNTWGSNLLNFAINEAGDSRFSRLPGLPLWPSFMPLYKHVGGRGESGYCIHMCLRAQLTEIYSHEKVEWQTKDLSQTYYLCISNHSFRKMWLSKCLFL